MLTYRDLKSIQEGNRRHADVMTLLREVRRLRDLAALAYAVVGYIKLTDMPQDERARFLALAQALRAEPAVIEYQKRCAKQKDLEFRRKLAMERLSAHKPPGAPADGQTDSKQP